MAQDVDLSRQRPAQYVFSQHVQEVLATIHEKKAHKQPVTALLENVNEKQAP